MMKEIVGIFLVLLGVEIVAAQRVKEAKRERASSASRTQDAESRLSTV